MPDYTTPPSPGVRLEHLLTEPARVLRTGVPVFLGLVNKEAIDAWNDGQDDPDERFLCKPLGEDTGPALVRKRGYLTLPSRAVGRSAEAQISDRSSHDPSAYLQAMPVRTHTRRYRDKVRSSLGAAGPAPAGQGQASDGDLLKAIGTKPQRFTVWPQFELTYRGLETAGFLTYAVRGFFENGGNLCYVQLLAYGTGRGGRGQPPAPQDVVVALSAALEAGLATLAMYDDYDLVCAPDLMWEPSLRENPQQVARLQDLVMAHCAQLGERMALLDAMPGGEKSPAGVIAHRDLLSGEAGALYYPWVRVPGGPEATRGHVPPCGHVAGVYARTDTRIGVHKAPANEVLEGVVDLWAHLTNDDQGPLNDLGINCLRAFPQRGIRVWGARTLSRGTTWRYVNVRRVVLTAARWIAANLSGVVFEPHTELLWARITRDLTVYLGDLARRGALAGPEGEAVFYVKCDAETNPPETRELGLVITEVGLQPAAPAEFVIIRIIHGPAGVEIGDPTIRTA